MFTGLVSAQELPAHWTGLLSGFLDSGRYWPVLARQTASHGNISGETTGGRQEESSQQLIGRV